MRNFLPPLWNEWKKPHTFNSHFSPWLQLTVTTKSFWEKNICKTKVNLMNYAWHKNRILGYMQIASIKSQRMRGVSHQPPFVGSCPTFSHTCLPCLSSRWVSLGILYPHYDCLRRDIMVYWNYIIFSGGCGWEAFQELLKSCVPFWGRLAGFYWSEMMCN